MLCTKCSRAIRPVVAIDIDGTLGDYHHHLVEFARGYLDHWDKIERYTGRQPYRQWFCKTFRVDETTFREVKLAYRQGGMKRTMPVEPGAVQLMQSLAPVAEVWLTTTRPYLRHDTVDKDTRAWLHRNDMPYDYLLYDEDKYEKLAEMVDPQRVVAVLDNEMEQVTAATTAFGPGVAILYGNRYNSAETRMSTQLVYYTLHGATEEILARAKDWSGVPA
jgi:5'(3')-deoxyribonucleotidase